MRGVGRDSVGRILRVDSGDRMVGAGDGGRDSVGQIVRVGAVLVGWVMAVRWCTSAAAVLAVADMLERHWECSKASVLISITGSAQDFDMPQRLLKAFKRGLVKAAQATNAFLITGGTDSGVMQLVGSACAEYDARVAVIGIATWGTVLLRHKLVGVHGGLADLTPEFKNSKM